MKRDLHSNIGAALALAPAVQAATIKGNAVDLKDFDSAELAINTGAVAGAGDFTAKWQESDTTTDGDFADIGVDHLIGTLPASLTADGLFRVGYIGSKRYVRPVLTKNGGTSLAASAVVIKGNPRKSPVA